MNFDFQQMKPLIQQDMDAVLAAYPTDFEHIRAGIPTGGDAYARKRAILDAAAQLCPVHIFPHYPFAFEVDVGEPRHVCYVGIGNLCRDKSGVDFAPVRELNQLLRTRALGSYNDYSDHIHRTLDHDKLLAVGFRGVYEECERLNAAETDPQKRRWRQLLMDACRTVETLGLRLRQRAAELLPTADDEDARYNLQRIVASINTPWEPPVTLFDAMNTILCTTLFISGLDGVEMNAYGQLDRLLQPYYERDLAAGRITEEEAYFLLQCFLHKTDMHCHFNTTDRTTYDNGVSVAIGGCDPEGRTVYNAMTKLILRAYTENRLINPKLNARAAANSPTEYFDALAALMRTGNNNLVVENDDYVIPMFERMGLLPEDARTYVGNGCQEVICRNQIHSRAFAYMNLAQVLLDTLRYTPDTLPEELREVYRYGRFDKTDYAALHASFLANLRSLLQAVVECFRPFEALHHTICPEVMLSAFTADCIASGTDMADGGARYNHKTFSLAGFGTLCDSLLALRRAYASGTQNALLAALENDFADAEPLRRALQSHPERFGHDDGANAFAVQLADELAQVTRGLYNARGIEWRTSLFTNSSFQFFGELTGATPDGRHAHQPLSRQMNMARLPQPTTAALALAQLSNAAFNDVGIFDVALPFTVADSDSAHRALSDFIRTCMALKLPVLQTNVADLATMLEERQHPGTHPDLVVRVCGYSAPFAGLSPTTQDEIISRSAV